MYLTTTVDNKITIYLNKCQRLVMSFSLLSLPFLFACTHTYTTALTKTQSNTEITAFSSGNATCVLFLSVSLANTQTHNYSFYRQMSNIHQYDGTEWEAVQNIFLLVPFLPRLSVFSMWLFDPVWLNLSNLNLTINDSTAAINMPHNVICILLISLASGLN